MDFRFWNLCIFEEKHAHTESLYGEKINLAGKSGATKLKFLEWLNESESEDQYSSGNSTDFFTMPTRRSLVTRGLGDTHNETAKHRLHRGNIPPFYKNSRLQQKTEVGKKVKQASLHQRMRKSIKQIWQQQPLNLTNDAEKKDNEEMD